MIAILKLNANVRVPILRQLVILISFYEQFSQPTDSFRNFAQLLFYIAGIHGKLM